MAPASSPRRRPGRPRARPSRRAIPPREEILEAAGRLFARRGFAATSTREIAARAGLRQPSLFHHFPSKDAILRELLDRAVAPALAAAEALEAEGAPPDEALFRYLRRDVHALCTAPYDLGALAVLPEARGPAFRGFWRARARLVAAIEGWIRVGLRAGRFVPVEPTLVARTVFGADEATLAWHREVEADAAAVGEAVACFALRGLLRDPGRLPALVARARERDPLG